MAQLVGQDAIVYQQVHILGRVLQGPARQGVGFVEAFLLREIPKQPVTGSGTGGIRPQRLLPRSAASPQFPSLSSCKPRWVCRALS